jgi:hypothetical protein
LILIMSVKPRGLVRAVSWTLERLELLLFAVPHLR